MKSVSVLAQLLCGLVLLLCSVGCERKRQFVNWDAPDHFCDGRVFSTLVVREDIVMGRSILPDSGSGTLYSLKTDVWMVQWQLDALHENQENPPSRVVYLGHFAEGQSVAPAAEQRAPDRFLSLGAKPRFLQMGDTVELFSLANDRRDQQLGTLALKPRRPPIFNRSRTHFLAWDPAPTIYASDSLAEFKKISVTPHFQEFEAAFHSTENYATVLTDDLRFLIAVPHNGGDSPVGFNHHKAHCYDFTTDAYTVTDFHFGSESTAIATAENLDEHLLFIAYANQKELALLNEQSEVIAALPAEGSRFFNFHSNFHWDHRNRRIFTSDSPNIVSSGNIPLELEEYDYEKHQKRHYSLRPGSLQVPAP